MPDLTDRYCVFWDDQHTARILDHYSHLARVLAQQWSSDTPGGFPPLAWLRLDAETPDVHVYAGAVEVHDRRWVTTLSTIQEAVNFCHAARHMLHEVELLADKIANDRRGYSRVMPALEWAPFAIYEVTWYYQREQDDASPPA